MLAMNFPRKGILKQWRLSAAQVLKRGWKMIWCYYIKCMSLKDQVLLYPILKLGCTPNDSWFFHSYTNLGYNILGHKFPSDSLIHILIRVEFPKNILLGINRGVIICKQFSYSYTNRVHHKWFPCYYINSCLNPKNINLALTKMQIH